MSRTATRATAALLCGVVVVALGLAVAAMSESDRAPESLSVQIDFDTFVPGVTQTRTSPVDVPVPSRVSEARVGTIGDDLAIAVDLTICRLDRCIPLETGAELDPGPHTITVEATTDAAVRPGTSAELVGEIRIVETSQPVGVDATLLMAVAGVSLLTIATGALLVGRRTAVAS